MTNAAIIYPGQKVAVMGLGVSGRAAAKYVLSLGAELLVSDNRPEEKFRMDEVEFLAGKELEWEAGGHSYQFLQEADLLLVSPGVNLEIPLLTRLREEGLNIVGELAVAAGQINVPIVAVTGTNGKTTVTTLIGEIFKKAGKSVFVGGNIGTPLYEYLMAPEGYDLVVVEVSSFQLESAGNFAPNVGVLLNISPDHLDRHHTLKQYAAAKKQLFVHQQKEDVAITNGDDPICLKISSDLQADLRTFGLFDGNSAQIDKGKILVRHNGVNEYFSFDGPAQVNTITLKNYAAAMLAAQALGCTKAELANGLRAFEPLPHRVEFVAEVNGVSYYNDSKATNTGAVIGALEQFDENTILVAGGRDKDDDFRLLRESVAGSVKKLVVLGEAATLLEAALGDLVDVSWANSLAEAVQIAQREAQPGDVVLLSPACASFDMFTSYGHRGDEFKKEVLALQQTL